MYGKNMYEKNKEKILMYIDNFVKLENNEIIDYYEVFNLNRKVSFEELKMKIEKLRLKTLFHEDNKLYIPDNLKDIYSKMCTLILDMENDFSSISKKEKYDTKLDEFLNKKKQEEEELFTNNNNSLEDNLKIFDFCIKENITKYGFYATYRAINKAIYSNDYKGFTRDFRIRKVIMEFGTDKLLEIINALMPREEADMNEIIICYFTRLLKEDNRLSEILNSYLNASKETLLRYDKVQLREAIKKLQNEESYNGFTNNLNVRTKMKEKVVSYDATILMLIYFESLKEENYGYGCKDLIKLSEKEVVKTFINEIERKLFGKNSIRGRR